MINSNKLIQEVKEQLIRAYDPLAIYIFGSYAWGCPDEDSSLEILVVIPHYTKDRYHTAVEAHKALMHIRVAKDILIYSKDEFERDYQDITTLCYKVTHEGKKIYAKI